MQHSADRSIDAIEEGSHADKCADEQPDLVRCIEFTASTVRLGSVVSYEAHLCLVEPPHSIEGRVQDVIITVDECCSSRVIRQAMTDPAMAADLHDDLGREALRRYLLRNDGLVIWKARALD